jgi:PPOX class probable F420-dependent enzyme
MIQHRQVSLNFNCTPSGGDVIVLTGDGWLDAEAPPVSANSAYVEKYSQGFKDIGMTPDAFSQAYSVPVRVRPTSLRGH